MALRRFLLLSGALGFFFFLALVLPAGATPQPTLQIRVPARAVPELAQLDLSPQVALDYETFRWLHLTAAQADQLTRAGIDHRRYPDAGQLRVNGTTFDPVTGGEPSLPPALTAAAGPGFRLVQFHGPVDDQWLAALAARGVRPLQYYPHFAYLVWDPAGDAAVTGLDFVRWSGPFHPAYKLPADLPADGPPLSLTALLYNDGALAETVREMKRQGGTVTHLAPAQPDGAFYSVRLTAPPPALVDLARLPTLLWLGRAAPGPQPEDEVAAQIVAGNVEGTTVAPGYLDHLAQLGVDGSGVTWAIVDTGVDRDHPDFAGRIIGGYTVPDAGCDAGAPAGDDCGARRGHGTHVAGIALADAATGLVDSSGFLYGMGVAPAGGLFAMNIFGDPANPSYPPYQEFSRQALLGGASGGNNSWSTGDGPQHGYQATERTFDFMVLDGNFDTAAVAEPFTQVFSAGNLGSDGLTAPAEAKNVIVVAGTDNARFGADPENISPNSSEGPTVDGRFGPTVAAPGRFVASTRNDEGGDQCATTISGTSGFYALCTGTSMAAAHASGALILATEWWRAGHGAGTDPSPALARALLINSAVDLGEADIPNGAEGWGRVNVTNLTQPAAATLYYDEPQRLAASGEQWQLAVEVFDGNRPVKITLAWSDAPGAVGANPALVNDLDLTVATAAGTFLGNVFDAGWSATGGTPDALNNVESVYIQTPVAGPITVTVDAANIAGDAVFYNGDLTDQHFALICHNCYAPSATLFLPYLARP